VSRLTLSSQLSPTLSISRSVMIKHTSFYRQYSLLLYAFRLLPGARSQVGTVTQDISTLNDFSLQKGCAQSCFQNGISFCPMDSLGIAIGCATVACSTKGWQAKNDCYCRSDQQIPGQEYLTSCIKLQCSVGNAGIDASVAGSIYARYCVEKGYEIATLPATNLATTTRPGKTSRTATAGLVSEPTSPPSSNTNETSNTPSSVKGLSMAAIIGIAVGSIVGLAILSWVLYNYTGLCQRRKPSHASPAPVFPQNVWAYHMPPRLGSDIGPNDSVSMVGMQPQVPPTLISAAGQNGRPW
jgi:hypothetical protein